MLEVEAFGNTDLCENRSWSCSVTFFTSDSITFRARQPRETAGNTFRINVCVAHAHRTLSLTKGSTNIVKF